MSAPASPAARERIDPRVWKITSVALLGPLMTNLDSTVVNVSLSTLVHDLHASLATLQWVITGYLLALALMLPLSGWLVDRVGAKRVYLGCFTLFTLASVLCGISTSVNALIGARVLQGMAGGLLAPMAQMMVAREAPRHIARVMGVMALPILLGPIFGPFLAGLILQHASWHWIFFINVPVGVLAILMASWILPKDVTPDRARTLDIPGLLLISPGLVLLLYGLESLRAASAARSLHLIEVAIALGLLALFIFRSVKRGRAALIDLNLFRDSSFSASASTMFLANAINFGGQLLLPLFLLSILHISPEKTGLVLASAGLGAVLAYPSMGAFTERFGSRRVSASGSFIALFATLPFAILPLSRLPLWAICVTLFFRGIGMGSIGIPSVAAAYSSIAKEAIPVATTALNIVQRLGGPVATTTLAIFLHARTTSVAHVSHLSAGNGAAGAFAATFWVLCAFHVATIFTSLRLPLRAGNTR